MRRNVAPLIQTDIIMHTRETIGEIKVESREKGFPIKRLLQEKAVLGISTSGSEEFEKKDWYRAYVNLLFA